MDTEEAQRLLPALLKDPDERVAALAALVALLLEEREADRRQLLDSVIR